MTIEYYEEDYEEDTELCDYCGRDVNGYDSGASCPYCCSSSYAPGSEHCDWCRYSDECYGIYYKT